MAASDSVETMNWHISVNTRSILTILGAIIMWFDDAERIYWVIVMHGNQLKVKIVYFKVILDQIRKRLSSVSCLYNFKSRECISGHTIFISRPIQDKFNFNNHYDKSWHV